MKYTIYHVKIRIIFEVVTSITWAEFFYVFYRVSSITGSTFVFLISLLPIGLEIPSWSFFNSPLYIDFENINFLLIGETWIKLFQKYYRDVILKVKIFRLLLNQALEHSKSLRSFHE